MSRRILAAVITVTVLALAAFFVPAAMAIQRAQERGELLELQREASVVASRVPASGPIDRSVLQPVVDTQHRLGLYGPDGVLLGGAGPERADRIVQVALAGNFAEGRVGDDLVAAVPVRALVDGSTLVMRIEAPRAARAWTEVGSTAELAAIGLVVIAAATGVGLWVARRLNRPIEQLRGWAAQPETVPPPPPTGIPELDSLRADLIDSRARIDELLRRERSFSSHVSHQLRTPVTALRVAIETEREVPRPDHTAVLDEALGQLDRLESTISSLLALARHDERPMTEAELRDVIDRRSAHWRELQIASGRELDVSGGPCAVRADVEAIGHVLDVLVENALRHGAGPVRVEVAGSAGYATVDVSDDGATPVDDDPFAEQTNDTGHGIGLRLAQALAESAGGRLDLLDGPTTTFRLTLPAGR
jgi:signal transduction histidine kinase